MRRVKRQALAVGGQQGIELTQRRACACGDNQLTRLVSQHAGQRRGIELLALQRLAIEILAAATANAQRGTGSRGRAHPVGNQFNSVGVWLHGRNGKPRGPAGSGFF